MNWLQRLFVSLAARVAPPLGKLLSTAGGKLEWAEMEIRSLRDRDSERRQAIRAEQQEIRESAAMLGPQWSPHFIAGKQSTAEALKESGAPSGIVALSERLWELELALEDRGWIREINLNQFEFSLMGIQRIIGICRLYALKNPLIRRGVQVIAFYVFGRGVTISSDDPDENAALQAFFQNPRNAAELGHTALVKKQQQLWTDGNIYWVFFSDEQTGELIVRTIDPIEIVDIVTDPDDASQECYLHRRWMAQTFDPETGVKSPTPQEAWYPALGYDPPVRPDTIGANKTKVLWDSPVMHWKAGGMAKWLYGVPLAYPAIDYGRAVKRLIDNWCSIQEAMTRFAWQVETQGGLPAIANLKQTLATTLAIGDGSQYEQNPPPTTASSWISGPGNKLAMSKTSGMIDGPEVGRRVAHLAYMVFGLPETFFADASVGTVATATSLDRPTELMMLEIQEFWREGFQRHGDYVILCSESAPQGKIREARKQNPKKECKAGSSVKVSFPSILEHDIQQQIDGIVTAATMNGFEVTGIDQRVAVGLLLQELQVENWQEVLELMYPEDEYEALMDRTELLAQQRDAALNPPPPPTPGTVPTGAPTTTPQMPAPGQPSPAQPPAVKSGKPKHAASEAARLERVVASLRGAAKLLEARSRK